LAYPLSAPIQDSLDVGPQDASVWHLLLERTPMAKDDKAAKLFGSKRFDTEHLLNLYATSFVIFPAFSIYDEDVLQQYADLIKRCHIYFIGLTPKVHFDGASQEGDSLRLSYTVARETYVIAGNLPEGSALNQLDDGSWSVISRDGNKTWPNMDEVMMRLGRVSGQMKFKVLYIGQAYGEDGSRNAIDRLKKHETLQKIALKGVPEGYDLTLLLIEVEPATRLITMFNPWAKEQDDTGTRISAGLDKLFGTDEEERTSLYEAAFIRYFRPEFNTVFKNSFPSTNMKTLSKCYEKDIATLVTELCFDELTYKLFSDHIDAKQYHTARHDLHKDEDRRVFFSEPPAEATT
jgi:hypothetical protein